MAAVYLATVCISVYYHVNVCFLLSDRKNEILNEKVVKYKVKY